MSTKKKLSLDDIRDRATISVEECAAVCNIGRGLAYECVRNGEIPSLSLGRLRLVPVPALLRWLGGNDPYPSDPGPAD